MKRNPLPFAMGLMMFIFLSLAAYQRFELQRLRGNLRNQGEAALVASDGPRRQLRKSVNRGSEIELRQAVKLGEKQVRDQRDRSDNRRSLALTYRRLGTLFVNTDRLTDASLAYEKATQLLRECLQLEPGYHESEFALAEVLGDSAETVRALGRTRHANELELEAVTLLRKLVAAHPEMPAYRNELTRALDRMNDAISSR